MAADVALCRGIIFLSLLGIYPLYQSIWLELRHFRRFLLDVYFYELDERIFFDLNNGQLSVLLKSRAEDSRGGAYFVLLGVSSLLCIATERFSDRFEVCIDY